MYEQVQRVENAWADEVSRGYRLGCCAFNLKDGDTECRG